MIGLNLTLGANINRNSKIRRLQCQTAETVDAVKMLKWC